MDLRKLVSVFAVISLLMVALGATTIMVGAQEATPEPTIYVVQEDDTYQSIADAFEVNVEALLEANSLDGSEELVPGQELVIPEPVVEETPTEEATEEATEEPTADPTEKATEQATEEATEEATEQATEEATKEPTAEPTKAATEEPAAAPPAERSQEGTGDVATQGAVGAAQLPGSSSSEFVGIQNLGSSPAHVILDLYPQGSSSIAATVPYTIPVNGNLVTSASAFNIANGAYAGVVSADQPVAAAVINSNYTSLVGDAYAGISSPAISQTIPLIFRGHALFYTKFHIQNATNSQQTVTVETYRPGQSQPAPDPAPTYSVPANTSITVDFMSSDFDDFGSGEGFFGYAVVEGSSGEIAVVAENYWDYAGQYQSKYINGVNAAAAGQDLIAPLVFNGHALFNSGFNIVNLGDEETTVTMTYSRSTVQGGGNFVHDVTIPARAVGNINMAALKQFEGWPESFGGASFHSSNTPIVGIVDSTKYYNGAVGFTTAIVDPALAATRMAVPIGLQLGVAEANWNTGITVYNVGGSGDVRTTWVSANTDPPQMYQITRSGTVGNVTEFNAAGLVVNGQLPAGFVGSVYIEALGPGQKLLGIANNDYAAKTISSQMLGHLYD